MPTYWNMENPLPKPLQIHVKMRYTKWYLWRCPKKGCPRRVEATVERFVETNAIRHLESHVNQKKRREDLGSRAAQALKEAS